MAANNKKCPKCDNRQLIISVVGESGVGKTTLAEHLAFFLNVKLIDSYTDRPRRTPDEIGHTFMTKEGFDRLKQSDMLAWTKFGDYRYCCLFSDLVKVNSYVVDENGMRMLWNLDKAKYIVKSIRVICSEEERIRRVGEERTNRDKGRFTIPYSDFDIIYNSEKFSSILEDIFCLCEIKDWINLVSDKKV